MKDHRKGGDVSWSRFFRCTVVVVFSCVLFTGFTFSSFRLYFGETFHPVVVAAWRNQALEAMFEAAPSISIREIVLFPDQAAFFLTFPLSTQLLTKQDLSCIYFSANSSEPQLKRPPVRIHGDEDGDELIVHCPLIRRFEVSLLLISNGLIIPPGPVHRWDSLVYEALIDRDNTTIAFVKGFNLKPERLSNASKFECVFGWDFEKSRFLLRSEVLSVSQEIVRCKTPLSLLSGPDRVNNTVKVSVRMKGGRVLNSIARPAHQNPLKPPSRKAHDMCICSMIRNQARFIREWVMYHAKIGVERWFVYDNNSDDDIEDIIESLNAASYRITRHMWPWIKTQEAGFAHCALRVRNMCEWVGFIDVDEFFHLPEGMFLADVLKNKSRPSTVAELRVPCHSFGPSGLKRAPEEGVTVGYTCRMAAPERHKSIVKPEALNSTLINVVHHFHLRDGFEFVNMDRGVMVINHYKYQVWEVFKEKFYRRVATYVADWTEEHNVGSKDRVPGLGTRAVEPPDWPSRFCEVQDTGLRNRVMQIFADPEKHSLPWQEVGRVHGFAAQRSSNNKWNTLPRRLL